MTKITCSKCGAQKNASEDRYAKLLEKHGGSENLNKVYLCRTCRPKKEKKVKAQVESEPAVAADPDAVIEVKE